jgi:hypothetical protein
MQQKGIFVWYLVVIFSDYGRVSVGTHLAVQGASPHSVGRVGILYSGLVGAGIATQ